MVLKVGEERVEIQRGMSALSPEIVLGVLVKTSYETQRVKPGCYHSAMPLTNVRIMRFYMVLKVGEERVEFQRGMTALSSEIVLGVMVKTSYESQRVKPGCYHSAMPLANVRILRSYMVLKVGEERVEIQRGMSALSPEIVLGVLVKTSYESQRVKPGCYHSAMPLANARILRSYMVLKVGEERVEFQRGMTALSPEIVLGVMLKTSYESQKVKAA
jgi:heterodisulfide reductase subunit C